MIDDLTLIKCLGKGSFGEVYLTTKEGHSQKYATKKIRKSMADAEQYRKYFINEITILQEINHKNIMKLIEIKQTKDNYYLVCELCNGGDLNKCLDKYRKMYRHPFSEEIVQFLMRQIVDAIKYLHHCRIIHRDLKLDNILVNFEKEEDKTNMNMFGAQIKIIDFGFATRLNKRNLAFSTLGSPINMDPGLLKKLNHIDNNVSGYDEKVDIWSLGTLCYEMLIGKATFEADNMKELVRKIETGEYTLPTKLSKEVVSFLNAMLQYDPKVRLSSEELSRHHFLTKNVKDFTKIDLKKVQKNLTGDDEIKINVKKNQSIWAIFNNDKDLDDVPGYILTEKEDNKFLTPIPENDNYEQNNKNINNNMNMNNNVNNNMNNNMNNNNVRVNNYKKTNTFKGPTMGNYGFMNHLTQKNKNFINNGNNYPNFNDFNKNAKIGRAGTFNQPEVQMVQTPKKDLRIDLQKAFDIINDDFLYIPPILIPLIPGNDPYDGYNEEEHL
jgi:serine/threonine protein kinase